MSQRAALGVQPVPPPRDADPRARVAHFAIFNPSIPAPPRRHTTGHADDKSRLGRDAGAEATNLDGGTLGGEDQAGQEAIIPHDDDEVEMDKDDVEQAAQIVFYTCPEDDQVPMDVKLKQVGLVRGLMAFTAAVAPGDEPWWSVHSNNARMVVWIADGYHFYVNIRDGKGWSDRTVADLLARGYQDFCLLHGPLPALPGPNDLSHIHTFYRTFIASLNNILLAAPPSSRLHTWLSHVQPSPTHHSAVVGAITVLSDDLSDSAPSRRIEEIGIITPTHTYLCTDRALERHLRTMLVASIPPPLPAAVRHPPGRKEEDARSRKISLGWAWPFGTSRPGTPVGESDGAGRGRRGSAALGRSGLALGIGEGQGDEGAGGSRRSSVDTTRASSARDSIPSRSADPAEGPKSREEIAKSTWLGLGGVPSAIGGAVGSMGTIFGLKPAESQSNRPASSIRAHELFPESSGTTIETVIDEGAVQADSSSADVENRATANTLVIPSSQGSDIDTTPQQNAATTEAPTEAAARALVDADTGSIRSVLHPSVRVSDLADAQEEQPALVGPSAKIQWESKRLCIAQSREWRMVKWTTREGILLFMVQQLQASDASLSDQSPVDAPPGPTDEAEIPDGPVHSCFNKLSSILAPDTATDSAAKSPSSRHTTRSIRDASPSARHANKADSAIWRMTDGQSFLVGDARAMREHVFADLRDIMIRHPSIDEVYTRTSATAPSKANPSNPAANNAPSAARGRQDSVFVGVKRSEQGEETYLAVGKVDASLVDADNSMRTMLRLRPEVAA